MRETISEYKPSEMRWANHHLPGHGPRMVLQQSWTRERVVYDADGRGTTTYVEVEWRDVPIWEVPYISAP